ncbi:energy-coupling factor transporter transmembrane component T family protein [Sanguibacter keddieii]|uniref:energy-coupling factor transporter transmembrane component T family protein n=1 Tax=Sanguibacter keddieii TaxID=60920 RepID=UPI0002FF912A|nr:energy-coupling factor transporter transmembrane protein EcfT [Sanguibacter keddieii]
MTPGPSDSSSGVARQPRRRAPRTRWTGPLGLYSPGSTWLHRLSPGWKILTLAVLSVALTVWRTPAVALTALGVAVLLLVVSGAPLRQTARALLPVTLVAALLGVFQWWSRDLSAAVAVSGTLLALVVTATVVTVTSPADRVLDTVVRAAGPLRHVGLSPEVVGLTVTLMLRSVPLLVELAWEVRDAARARGLERSPRAYLVPFVLRTVARAHRTGDALAARGIVDGDDVEESRRRPRT